MAIGALCLHRVQGLSMPAVQPAARARGVWDDDPEAGCIISRVIARPGTSPRAARRGRRACPPVRVRECVEFGDGTRSALGTQAAWACRGAAHGGCLQAASSPRLSGMLDLGDVAKHALDQQFGVVRVLLGRHRRGLRTHQGGDVRALLGHCSSHERIALPALLVGLRSSWRVRATKRASSASLPVAGGAAWARPAAARRIGAARRARCGSWGVLRGGEGQGRDRSFGHVSKAPGARDPAMPLRPLARRFAVGFKARGWLYPPRAVVPVRQGRSRRPCGPAASVAARFSTRGALGRRAGGWHVDQAGVSGR